MKQPSRTKLDRIAFEPQDLRDIRDGRKEGLPLYLESISERPGNLVSLARQARSLMACTMLLDPDDAEAEQWLRLLCRCLILQAARTIPGDGPVTLDVPLLGRTTVPRAAGSKNVLGLRTYVEACHATYALDDPEAAAVLREVPLDALEDDPLKYQLLHAKSLQCMLRQEIRQAAIHNTEALVDCNDESRPDGMQRYAMYVVSPEIELAASWGQPAGEWDGRVLEAIKANREFAAWETDGNPTASSYVMLGALAFAAIRNAEQLPSSPSVPELPLGLVYRNYGGLGSNPRTGD